jgi:hypothetical protein
MKIMKIKTADLIGAQLDWAVAKCEGTPVDIHPAFPGMPAVVAFSRVADGQAFHTAFYRASTNWALAGPIIEREGILFRGVYGDDKAINAFFYRTGTEGVNATGKTHLIAAMRCYVASKMGDEIEIPEELA